MSESLLEVFVITYNRAPLLKRTLEYLAASDLREFPITVLDNASTDDTIAVAREVGAALFNFKLITHHVNIGANANILRAFEYSRARYTWILCDDDFIDLSSFTDVLEVIEEGAVDLIHVGAHPQKQWILGGERMTPRSFIDKGYRYFKFSSFTPCNIIKTKSFTQNYMIKGYNNIVNAYPHMPFLLSMYEQDKLVYISKQQIVIASETGQSYNIAAWFGWWMRTCKLLNTNIEVRLAFLDHWKDNGDVTDTPALDKFYEFNKHYGTDESKLFIKRFFNKRDKAYFFEIRLKKMLTIK